MKLTRVKQIDGGAKSPKGELATNVGSIESREPSHEVGTKG